MGAVLHAIKANENRSRLHEWNGRVSGTQISDEE